MELKNNMTDAQLVVLYQQTKEGNAFGALYQRYYEKIFRYCRSIVKDRETALDLTQDIFLKAAEHLDRLKNPLTFSAWLFRIAHNECIDQCKGNGKTITLPDALQNRLLEDVTDAEEAVIRERQFLAMEDLLQELGDDARAMLQLKYLQHYSIQDLQSQFHLSESAVKMRLSRARNRVERLYERRFSNL